MWYDAPLCTEMQIEDSVICQSLDSIKENDDYIEWNS